MKKFVWSLCMAATVGLPAMGADVKPIPWSEKLTIKGDFRYRHEYIDNEKNGDNYHRDRLRARIEADAQVNSDLLVVLGLSSGNSDPVSSNQTLGDGETRKSIMLELAYADWTLPIQDVVPGKVNVVGGKMRNPFLIPGASDLIWDGDMNPEGAALKYKNVDLDLFELMANGGYIWVVPRNASDDSMLYAGQLGMKAKYETTAYLTVGGSYYGYSHMDGNNVIDFSNAMKSYGNSTTTVKDKDGKVTSTLYAEEFKLMEGMAELGVTCPLTGLPWKFYADYVRNSDPSDNNVAYLGGVSFGEAKDKNQFSLAYQYRKVEADAVVGAFTDSDNGGGGTNYKGHTFRAAYVIAKNWVIGTALFVDKLGLKSGEAEKNYDRVQVDLVAKF